MLTPMTESKDHMTERGVVRHEEQLVDQGSEWREIGGVRARKVVGTYRVVEDVPVAVDDVRFARAPVEDGDSGQVETLPDGSISIPVFEEEVVIEKRTILKERVIVRRDVVTETARVETELRQERVEVEADPGVELRVDE